MDLEQLFISPGVLKVSSRFHWHRKFHWVSLPALGNPRKSSPALACIMLALKVRFPVQRGKHPQEV